MTPMLEQKVLLRANPTREQRHCWRALVEPVRPPPVGVTPPDYGKGGNHSLGIQHKTDTLMH